MGKYRKLWFTLIGVLAVTFTILGYFGREVYREAPPIPEQIVTTDGRVLMTNESILDGQTAWQSIGGMQLGSIWGHGAYQAPDWTADWLHRELEAWLELASQEEFGVNYADLDGEKQQTLQYRLKQDYRTNTYDLATDTAVVSERRAKAMAEVNAYYHKLFSDAPEYRQRRDNYAMKENTLPKAERREVMNQFF
ncbi:MAG TPA: nitric-oxide reductase large subunit, partial [Kangiella sp.]